MTNTILRGKLLGTSKPSDICIDNGRVVSIRPAGRGRPDAGSRDSIIAPTLFDIQVNGFGGIDLQDPKLTPEDVAALSNKLAATGVSHWVPTLITASQKSMERGCRVLGEALQDRTLAHAIPGIHLEGPYISPNDGPRGAHAKRHVRKPSIREFDACMKAVDGKILYTTVAPEVPGAIPYIKALVKRGVRVSLGHHQADADTIRRAVDAGATLSTHLGNGMAPLLQRHFNPLWPQLAEDRLTCSLIADLHHLPPDVLKTYLRAKGPTRAILTSDVTHLAGLKPGKYDLAGTPVELTRTGRICLSGTELLAGSALELLQGIVNVARVTDLTLEEAFRCATTIPAKALGVRHPFDLPRKGKKVNFIAFRVTKNRPQVDAAYVNGISVNDKTEA